MGGKISYERPRLLAHTGRTVYRRHLTAAVKRTIVHIQIDRLEGESRIVTNFITMRNWSIVPYSKSACTVNSLVGVFQVIRYGCTLFSHVGVRPILQIDCRQERPIAKRHRRPFDQQRMK